MTAGATLVKPWGTRDSLWLSLAIFAHALLLLIPVVDEDHTSTSRAPLHVTLLTPPSIEKRFVENLPSEKSDLPVVKSETVVPVTQPVPKLARQKDPNEQTDQERIDNTVFLTTARLLLSASEMDWAVPEIEMPRQLGVFVPGPIPENRRSGASDEDNLFKDMTRPNKTEIVDRWLAADGSHNFVVNTATGHTFCGRAPAWDPMRPLVEHVIQFQSCGGGKRTFEMSWRPAWLTDSNSLANFTTN